MEETTPSPESSVPPATPAVPASSLSGRLFNVFATPGDVFDEVKATPPSAGNWVGPAILFILLSWVSAWLIFSQDSIQQQLSDMTNKAAEQQAARQKSSGQDSEQARQTAENMVKFIYKFSAVAGPVILAVFLPFWWGLIVWLVGNKALKGSFPFMKSVEVAGLGTMILCLDVIVRTLLVVLKGNVFAAPGLVLFVKDFDPQNTVHGLLALVNLTVFWVLLVRSIGLARLSGASLRKSALWIFGFWAAYTGFFFALGAALKTLAKGLKGG
jgi:hypothetical protein